ncbi:hypothetical protein FHETE_3694 [Fusarium heterosporum]|uniref:Uncharacterized protein n=1 Tax=Fusarium heterosporum TaxID=42747 RepID=A0A8H5WVJ2_FUSHE|nr:hypothetical protein FHETE_3694 [Fusarium heterosporum]
MSSSADKQNMSSTEKDKQKPVMLEVWLHEPKEIASASDVWSSERASVTPRPTTDDTIPRRPKKKNGDVAEAA